MYIDSSFSLFSGYNISCWDSTNGRIKIDNVKGGIPQFTFYWRDSTNHLTAGYTDSINNLHSGIYSVRISYQQNSKCYQDWNFTLSKPYPIQISDSTSKVNGYEIRCFADSSGYIQAKATGGVG